MTLIACAETSRGGCDEERQDSRPDSLLTLRSRFSLLLMKITQNGRGCMKELIKMTREDIINFISRHKAEFEERFGIKKIGLFGSYARGEVRDGSDIDIVVELKKPDLFCLIGIKQAIEEALGHKVDVVRLRDKMNDALKRRIERDAIYV